MMSSRKILSRLGQKAVSEIRKELKAAPTRDGKSHIATGKLYNETSYAIIDTEPGVTQLVLEMPDYAGALDRGQSGTAVKYDTPYNFKATVNDVQAWLKVKGDTPDKRLKSTAKSLQKSLLKKGVRPTHFLENSLRRTFSQNDFKLLTAAYADELLEVTLEKLEKYGWKK